MFILRFTIKTRYSSFQKSNIKNDICDITYNVTVRGNQKGYFELVQPFLIQKIIDLLGIEGESVHNTKPNQQ